MFCLSISNKSCNLISCVILEHALYCERYHQSHSYCSLFSPHPSREFQLFACTMRCLKSKLVMHQLHALFLLKQAVTSLRVFLLISIGWPTWKNAWYTPMHLFCLVSFMYFLSLSEYHTVPLFCS